MAGRGATSTHYRVGTSQEKAYTSAAGTIDSAVGDQTYVVRVSVSSEAHVKVGDGTATTSDMLMYPNTVEYFTISPGETVSAIRKDSDGTLYVTEMTA